jgi:hypothetical protein
MKSKSMLPLDSALCEVEWQPSKSVLCRSAFQRSLRPVLNTEDAVDA